MCSFLPLTNPWGTFCITVPSFLGHLVARIDSRNTKQVSYFKGLLSVLVRLICWLIKPCGVVHRVDGRRARHRILLLLACCSGWVLTSVQMIGELTAGGLAGIFHRADWILRLFQDWAYQPHRGGFNDTKLCLLAHNNAKDYFLLNSRNIHIFWFYRWGYLVNLLNFLCRPHHTILTQRVSWCPKTIGKKCELNIFYLRKWLSTAGLFCWFDLREDLYFC